MIFDKLSSSFFTEKSVLDVSDLVQWKRSQGCYNVEKLPKTAIVTLNKHLISKQVRLFSKKIKGIMGDNYLINPNVVVCTNFGNGAPAMVGVLEELRVLGVTHFIFIGLAGSLDANNAEGDCCVVTETFSATGCAAFYNENKTIYPIDNEWFNNIKTKLNFKPTSCWSTDAPFRETPSLIAYYTDKGAKHVDMECAAIYAFAKFYQLNALCVLVTADSFLDGKWMPPKKNGLLRKHLQNILKICLKLVKNG